MFSTLTSFLSRQGLCRNANLPWPLFSKEGN
jgi:hypothetical protein